MPYLINDLQTRAYLDITLWLFSLWLCFKDYIHVSFVQIDGFLLHCCPQVLREQPTTSYLTHDNIILVARPLGPGILEGAVHVLQFHLKPVLSLHSVSMLSKIMH